MFFKKLASWNQQSPTDQNYVSISWGKISDLWHQKLALYLGRQVKNPLGIGGVEKKSREIKLFQFIFLLVCLFLNKGLWNVLCIYWGYYKNSNKMCSMIKFESDTSDSDWRMDREGKPKPKPKRRDRTIAKSVGEVMNTWHYAMKRKGKSWCIFGFRIHLIGFVPVFENRNKLK